MKAKRLSAQVLPVSELSAQETRILFEVFRRHYDGVTWNAFQHDLSQKDYVILLRDVITGEPRGFSTQQIIDCEVSGQRLRALFSGDTIIDRAFWGEQELVRSWCRFAGQILAEEPHLPLYWFLISKGYRTYLFLPLFYHEFFPRYDAVTPPFEQDVMNALAQSKFGENYSVESGLVQFGESHGQLTAELAETPSGRRSHPHVQYFLQRNPGYARGDEVVCLAHIHPDNMKSFAAECVREGLRIGPPQFGPNDVPNLLLQSAC